MPEKPPIDDRYRHEKQNPSFSSTLLDKIYRSIDESDAGTMVKQQRLQSNAGGAKIGRVSEMLMEKKVRERIELERKSKHDRDCDALFSSSGSNSTDSGAGVMFSSAMESVSRPKPIRTGSERTGTALFVNLLENSDRNRGTRKQSTEAFVKPKSKNSNFFINSKQPISPGGRVAAFLNSIFSARNGKKSKDPSLEIGNRVSRSAQSSTCSSASSFSRSCLSRHSPAAEVKRSVRFCTGEEERSSLMSVPARKVKQRRRLEEAARGFLRRYRRDRRSGGGQNDESSDQNDDDGSSCSSSDLFELEHLEVMGCDRYREELPVYETTRLDSNRVIANGLRM